MFAFDKEAVSVHPRVCGERRALALADNQIAGSSPRVRGTLVLGSPLERLLRFIPACAGNARWQSPAARRRSVHPRVCGERRPWKSTKLFEDGSSPRVRGTQIIARVPTLDVRFIPACAGNAWLRHELSEERSVHPRVCGERRKVMVRLSLSIGSSPRVRGTLGVDPIHSLCGRFIPACAGNAFQENGWFLVGTVHPRVCGERSSSLTSLDLLIGSSPRVRGTLLCLAARGGGIRFIPACAGNARYGAAVEKDETVHPRVCGERLRCFHPLLSLFGSSPRVRGTPARSSKDSVSRRFIPACAGNAKSQFSRVIPSTVHPRVCGERYTLSPP